jgi:hypothetical protein
MQRGSNLAFKDDHGHLNPLIITSAQNPAVQADIEALIDSTWPLYTTYGRPAQGSEMFFEWERVYRCWPEFQFALYDRASEEIIACGNAVPIFWQKSSAELPETGWDWAMQQGFLAYQEKLTPTALIPLCITVRKDLQRSGLSRFCLNAMRDLATEHNLSAIFAPVRPVFKAKYPKTSITEYMSWKTIDGKAFDPWVRTHINFGGRIVKPCTKSMSVVGSLSDWKSWTGIEFSKDGPHEVPNLLAPLNVNLAKDEAIYEEPNIWVEHLF